MNKRKIIIFDTEDNSPEILAKKKSGFDKKVTQIAALSLDGDEYYSKGDIKGFLKWLRSCKPCIVYAHNLQYDLGNILADRLDEIEATLIGSRLIVARWGGIEFRDSMNLWPMAVKKIGEAFGLQKKQLNIRSKAYVFTDVKIVKKAIEFVYDLAGEYNIESIPNTLGSLCVKLWKELGGQNWYCDLNFCRAALYGGRVELFEREAYGKLLWTDINSLYPYVMTFKFPDELRELKDIEGYGIAGVTVQIPKDSFICPLPYRLESGKIQYPCGRLSGIWTFGEIHLLLQQGGKLLTLHDAVGSKSGSVYYANFVEHFYRLRRQTQDEAKKLFYKLLMNNLYGQLAMRGVITKISRSQVTEKWTQLPSHVNYMHGSCVTAYGRLMLDSYMRRLGNKLIYCDTDSTIFHGPSPFEYSDELGGMKLVTKGKYCETISPKTYVFDDKYVAKGVPKQKAKDYITNKVVEYDQPYKFRDAIRFFERGNVKQLSVWRPIEKKLVSEYSLKRLGSDGKFYPKEPIEDTKEQLDLEF